VLTNYSILTGFVWALQKCKGLDHKILASKAVEESETTFSTSDTACSFTDGTYRTIALEREQRKRNLLYDLPARSPNDDHVPI
jgi:hypothetical protein